MPEEYKQKIEQLAEKRARLNHERQNLLQKQLIEDEMSVRDNTRTPNVPQVLPIFMQLGTNSDLQNRVRNQISETLAEAEEKQKQKEAQERFANMTDEERKAWVQEQWDKTEGLSEADSATDWYHAIEEDPQKRAEWDRQADVVSSIGSAVATLPFGIGSIGLAPTLTTTATAYAGAYGGQKLGEAIDEKYGTNTTPWLSIIGSILGGGAGYKGMVNLGSKGYLRGVGNMYGPQFKSDVAYKILDNNISSITPVSTLTQPIPYTSGIVQPQSKPHINWFTAKKDYDRIMQIRRHNDFAQKYNSILESGLKKYPIVPETISDEALDIATKKMLRQHNTYYRGLYFDKDIKELMKTKGLTLEEAFRYTATNPKTIGSNNMPNYTWITPYSSYGAIYSTYGPYTFPYESSSLNLWKRLARVRRKYTLGPDRSKWFDEADFSMDAGKPTAYNVQTDIADIWGLPGIDPKIMRTEYLGKNLIFDGWEPSWDGLSFGSRNTKVNNNELINPDH